MPVKTSVRVHEFRLILAKVAELSPELADALYQVFDDGTAVSTTLFDGPVDSYNVDATEFLEDDDCGPDEIHWDTFALDGKGIAGGGSPTTPALFPHRDLCFAPSPQ